MKKTTTLIYSIFASLIYLFSILFLTVNIYNEYKHGYVRLERKWEKITNIIQVTSSAKDLSLPENKQEIENIIGDFSDIKSFELNQNGKVIYSYGEAAELQENSSTMIQPFTRAFSVNNNNIYITAQFFKISPYTIFVNTKISFLIILVITIITTIILIYLTVKDKSSTEAKIEEEELEENADDFIKEIDFSASEPLNLEEKEDKEEVKDTDLKEIDTEKDINENNSNEVNNNNYDENSENIIEATKEDNESTVADENNDVVEEIDNSKNSEAEKEEIKLPVEDTEPVKIETEDSPTGLFNPETGLGWESYLMPRLENELNRATASEIDLALFIIKLPEIEHSDKRFGDICNYLENQFQFKDLMFEYGKDNIAAMKISMNIDEALLFADKLSEEISALDSENPVKCYIGLSTRTVRMITGERLLKEATEAMEHALIDEESNVIAFRADAAKYRKFIENS